MKKKNRKKIILLLLLLLTGGLFLGAFYWSTHSQKGLKWTWARLLSIIPGTFQWNRLDIDFIDRTLQIDDLSYTHPSGYRIVFLESLRAKFRFSSIFRTRAILEDLQIKGLLVDLSSLPPRKKPTLFSPVLQALTKRLAIEKSTFLDTTVKTKKGSLSIPQGNFSFWPKVLGEDTMAFSFSQIQGELIDQPLFVETVQYEGVFSLPDIVHDVFLFRSALGKFTMKGVQFGRWKIEDLLTEAAFNGTTLDFKGIDLTVGQGRYHLKLQFDPFDQRYEGNLTTVEPIPSEEVPAFPPKLIQAYQKIAFSLDFKLAGFLFKEMEGTLSMNLKALGNRINPKTPTLNVLVASRVKQGRFELAQFSIQNERTQMKGTGWVDLAQMQLGVGLSGTGFDLFTFIHFFSEQEIHGYADFSGTIKGPLQRPDFRFQGRAVETGYKFMRYGENEGTFEILNGNMRYSGRSPAGASYSDTIDVVMANLFEGPKRHTTLKTVFNNIDVSALLENPEMTGKLSGQYEMDVFQGKKNGKLSAGVKDFHLYQFHIGDMETQGNLVNNTFSFPPFTYHPLNVETVTTPRETVFQFDDKGFTFKGAPMAGMSVEGGYIYARENVLDIKVQCAQCATAPLLATLDQRPIPGNLDGKMVMQLILGNFPASKMVAEIDRLQIPIGEANLTQSGTLQIGYRQGAFHFDRAALAYNSQVFKLGGSFTTQGPVDLSLNGDLDLGIAKAFEEYVRDAGGPARIDLKIRGTTQEMRPSGSIEFNGATVSLRALRNTLEDLKGKIEFDEQKIFTQKLEGTVDDGLLRLTGTLWHDRFNIKKADLQADAREISYSDPGNYKLIFSGKLTLTGEAPRFLLAGNLDITEGRYIKSFDIREFILQPTATPGLAEKTSGFEKLNLDLNIRSPGELLIKNNVAEIYLKSNLHITGTKEKPTYEGALEVLDGEFHYFKLNFENAKGFIDFRDPAKGKPYVDITAQKEFERPSEDVTVTVHMEGFTDNLQLSFASNPPLEKRDILALVFTGALPEEQRSISGSSIASSVLASQLTSVLEGPVTGLTGLDIFRLEASDPDSKSLTTLVVGKKLTERLSLEFKTDLALEESVKSVQAEYLLFDNILLKGSRATNGGYRLELTFRLKGY